MDPSPATDQRTAVTVQLCVKGAARAIEFYRKAFGATELFRLTDPGGKIGHAEITVGTSLIMLSDEYPDFGALSPTTIGGSPVRLHLSVADADAAVDRALRAGATLLRPLVDEFYGARTGMIADPFGFRWSISTQKEPVAPEEMQRRWSAALSSGKSE